VSEPIALQTISVDGFTCYDGVTAPTDEDGNLWVWQDIEGWFGGLDVRGAPVERPLTDGDFDGPAPLGSRTVTVKGTLIASTRAGLQRGLDRLAAVLTTVVRRSDLVVDEAQRGVTRTATVRLGGPTQVSRKSTYQADWSLSLYAADPLRYGTVVNVITILPFSAGSGRVYNLVPNRHYGKASRSGTGDVVNAGNASTPLQITFYGPCTNPGMRIVGGAETQYMGTLTANDRVVIDTASRTVLLNGANRRQNLSATSRWLSAPPGTTRVYHWVDNVDRLGSASVAWRDAWA
jgi:hypothetical protein